MTAAVYAYNIPVYTRISNGPVEYLDLQLTDQRQADKCKGIWLRRLAVNKYEVGGHLDKEGAPVLANCGTSLNELLELNPRYRRFSAMPVFLSTCDGVPCYKQDFTAANNAHYAHHLYNKSTTDTIPVVDISPTITEYENEVTPEMRAMIEKLGFCRGLIVRPTDVKMVLPYINLQGNEEEHEFIFESVAHSERAREFGQFHLMMDTTKGHLVMNYDFLPEYALVYPFDFNATGTRKICKSFLPCLGLAPNTMRKDLNALWDFRVRAFKNHGSKLRKVRFEDYLQPVVVINVDDDTSDVYGDMDQSTRMCMDVFGYIQDDQLPLPIISRQEPSSTPLVEPLTADDADSVMFAATIKAIQNIKKCDILTAMKYYTAVEELQ